MNIDREIAEKVMGYTRSSGSKTAWLRTNEKGMRKVISDWKPSTNIQHAMEVEAEMFRRGWKITMKRGGKVFWAEFQNDDVSNVKRCYANTLPEAICAASLQALEVE